MLPDDDLLILSCGWCGKTESERESREKENYSESYAFIADNFLHSYYAPKLSWAELLPKILRVLFSMCIVFFAKLINLYMFSCCIGAQHNPI